MLKKIRNFNFGWIIILTGFVVLISGISITEGNAGGKTLLCFDQGCIFIQGISNIAIGIFCVAVGIYMILK